METISVKITPDLSLEFVETKRGRYRAEHPIRNEEFCLIRKHVISQGEDIHWGEDTFEMVEYNGNLYYIMCCGTANTILQTINSYLFASGNKGKCLLPRTCEIIDEIHSHWLQSDADEIGRLSKVPLCVDDEKQRQMLRQIATEINSNTRACKQLLWLIYEPHM